ncbi:MAG: hypothetical protein OEY29_13715 [Gammaproteobacteria bacterium]|nr:hypothetical protein [Gammaproteobacteria bacterium]
MKENLYIHSEDREILRDLFINNDVLCLYKFHEKYLLSPGQIARVIRKYIKNNIFETNENTIKLTEHGKKWVYNNRNDIFRAPLNELWKQVPAGFSLNEEKRNEEPYKPNFKNIIKQFRIGD